MVFNLDSVLAVVRSTILHPFASVALLCAVQISGLESTNIHILKDFFLGRSGEFPRLRMPVSGLTKAALACVAFSWIVAINRKASRSAQNPGKSDTYDWPKEIVVVTGGSGGIGGVLVQKLEKLGATVVVLDITPLTYTKGKSVHYYKCDVSELSAVEEVCRQIKAKVGHPTVVVANAGIVRGRTILDASEQDIRKTFAVNVLGLYWCIKVFLPDMLAGDHGHILITSSSTAFATVAGSTDYSASKAAVSSTFEGLQTELKHKYGNTRVRASAVFPATIKTKMFEGIQEQDAFMMPALEPEQVAERMLAILKKGESETAMMPAMANFLPWMRILPIWLRVSAQDVGKTAMDNLKNVEK